MDVDLDALCIAVYRWADDLLPQPSGGRLGYNLLASHIERLPRSRLS